jgi:hypothetical protein
MTWVATVVGVGVAGATAGVNAISRGHKKRKAQRAMDNRPKYEIPKEIFQNQAMYESMANSSRVPGQKRIENQIAQNTAQSIGASQRAAGSSADALSAVSGINQNANNTYNELGMQGAQMQMANKDKLAQARQATGDYRQQDFDYNKNQKYLERMKLLMKQQDESRADTQNLTNSLGQVGMAAAGSGGKKGAKGSSGGNSFYGTSL